MVQHDVEVAGHEGADRDRVLDRGPAAREEGRPQGSTSECEPNGAPAIFFGGRPMVGRARLKQKKEGKKKKKKSGAERKRCRGTKKRKKEAKVSGLEMRVPSERRVGVPTARAAA